MNTRYLIFLCLLLFGCASEENPKVIVAERELQAYATPEGNESYIILKGEICAAGEKKGMKVFLYMEVVCPGKGYAWVIVGDHYKVEKNHDY